MILPFLGTCLSECAYAMQVRLNVAVVWMTWLQSPCGATRNVAKSLDG